VKRIKIGFFSFLILVLLVEISLLTQALFYPQNKSLSSISRTQTNDSTANSLAILYSQLIWKTVLPTDQNSILRYSKNSMVYSDSAPLPLSMKGQEFIAIKKSLSSDQESSLYKDFISFYDQKLSQTGWEQQIEYKNSSLSTIVTDGINGNTWGYLKISNDTLGVFILSRIVEFHGKAITQPPSCPCDVEYRIFISDPIPTSEIKK